MYSACWNISKFYIHDNTFVSSFLLTFFVQFSLIDPNSAIQADQLINEQEVFTVRLVL